MSNMTDRTMTAEQLAALPDDGKRYELLDGVLHMMSPAGGDHGEAAAEVLLQLRQHVKRYRLGKTYAAETGFLLDRNPDTVLAPDVSFVSNERLGANQRHRGFIPICPDLVAEVVSPSDRTRAVEGKVHAWLDAGVLVVLVIDPVARTVRSYRPGRQVEDQSEGLLDLQDVVAGFQLDVSELFA